MSIDHRRSDVGMAEQSLNGADIVIGLQQMGGEAVSEGVRGDPLDDPGLLHRLLNGVLDMRFVQMVPSIPDRVSSSLRYFGVL